MPLNGLRLIRIFPHQDDSHITIVEVKIMVWNTRNVYIGTLFLVENIKTTSTENESMIVLGKH